jgi:glutathione synthase
VASTWLLGEAERHGARVFNSPRALRDHNEKFAIAEFPQFTVPSLVSRSMEDLQRFVEEHKNVVLKRLDGMGGAGIFRVRHDDPNRNVIVETISSFGTRSVMAQRYIPEITQGDKRVLLIDGNIVPHCLARIPKAGESRGNLAAGARGEAQAVTPRHREIAAAIGPQLAARGLLLVGLDVIGDWMTEINVTSPTCFREIQDQTGFDVAGTFLAALESKLQ